MTDIAFHFNMPDKLQYACRLLRKGFNGGAKLTVTGPQELLADLDARLWTFSALDFIPHVICDHSSPQTNRSPVLLTSDISHTQRHPWLLNVGDTVPMGFERFERVIELVGTSDEDRERSRARWREYSAGGHKIDRFDVAGTGTGG